MILSYHVARRVPHNGRTEWLDDSEQAWSFDFLDAAAFTDATLADDIGKRECQDEPFYVLACMASR